MKPDIERATHEAMAEAQPNQPGPPAGQSSSDFESLLAKPRGPVDPAVVAAEKRAEFGAKLAAARRSKPRMPQQVIDDAISWACFDYESAMSCVYARPQSGAPGGIVSGASIRLAEIVKIAYGHLHVGVRLLPTTDTAVHAEAYVWDALTNDSWSVPATRSIIDRNGRRFSPDNIAKNEMGVQSIAARNAIFKIVPPIIKDHVLRQVRATIAQELCPHCKKPTKREAADAKGKTWKCLSCQQVYEAGPSIEQRLNRAVNTLEDMGVTTKQILQRLGVKGPADIGIDEIVTLGGLYNAIKAGEVTVAEAFPT